MRALGAIKTLFVLAAIYDGALGVSFLLASNKVFQWFEVTPPNHLGYIHFAAALLIVFAIMFVAIAIEPAKNRNLIPYGILLKLSYSGVVLFHWLTAGLPNLWKPFCIVDLVFLLLFAYAWQVLGVTHPREA